MTIDIVVDAEHYRIDELCRTLFDEWCERRSVIPLTYLMHAWPMLSAGKLARSRVLSTLQELRQFHPETLTYDEHCAVEQALGINIKTAVRDS